MIGRWTLLVALPPVLVVEMTSLAPRTRAEECALAPNSAAQEGYASITIRSRDTTQGLVYALGRKRPAAESQRALCVSENGGVPDTDFHSPSIDIGYLKSLTFDLQFHVAARP
jgi:hypothetical protein